MASISPLDNNKRKDNTIWGKNTANLTFVHFRSIGVDWYKSDLISDTEIGNQRWILISGSRWKVIYTTIPEIINECWPHVASRLPVKTRIVAFLPTLATSSVILLHLFRHKDNRIDGAIRSWGSSIKCAEAIGRMSMVIMSRRHSFPHLFTHGGLDFNENNNK